MSKIRVVLSDLYKSFARSIREQLLDFERPLPKKCIRYKEVKEGSPKVAYVPWPIIKRLADFYSPGWKYEIVEEGPIQLYKAVKKGQRTEYVEAPGVFMKCRVTIYHYEEIERSGNIVEAKLLESYREATAYYPTKSKGYGDAVVNCEAKVLRRCWGRWGIGLHLWQPDGYVYRGDEIDIEEIVGNVAEDDFEEGVDDLGYISGDELDGEARLEIESKNQDRAENIPASTLYDLLEDAGCKTRASSNLVASYVLGFEVSDLKRVSSSERVLVMNFSNLIRSTLKKLDARYSFIDWLVLKSPSTIPHSGSREDFYKIFDEYVSERD